MFLGVVRRGRDSGRGAPSVHGKDELDARAEALRALARSPVPFLVAGAYALFEYTGIYRDTKDLDLFVRARDLDGAFRALEAAGFRTELTDRSWIGKAWRGKWYVDLIFSSGNGVAVVDDAWFENARPGRVMDVAVLLAPPEEIIWSKSFVLERERYDGADVNHLLHHCGRSLDWRRLLARFDRYWEVLLSHLMLFRFAYPGSTEVVPDWVMGELLGRAAALREHPRAPDTICRGNLISRVQYQHDLDRGLGDGRRWDEADRLVGEAEDGGGKLELPAGGGG
jgi:hypothetical protein